MWNENTFNKNVKKYNRRDNKKVLDDNIYSNVENEQIFDIDNKYESRKKEKEILASIKKNKRMLKRVLRNLEDLENKFKE